MEVQYQCTLADFLEGVAHQPKPFMWYVNWAGGIFFFLAAVLTAVTGDSSRAISYFFLASVFLAWPLVIRPLGLRRNFRDVPNFALKQVLITGEDGLLTRSDAGRTENKWPAYTKFQETPNLLILWMGAGMWEVIPKRAFSAVELDEFRHLLVRHLPGK
jgi:hypothetical protein